MQMTKKKSYKTSRKRCPSFTCVRCQKRDWMSVKYYGYKDDE
jgi:hypothetical protein